ncbi:hypothetical protein F2P81_023207 [Scophthalmus maximus]|uniref:Uncharacterized protein n=1 Tax=Scophthalmus maximus TaxID=52904 RepID=A0A6A4RW28_SCOMX|nr:hypothetical protein F2P81_023207 [Scophthalmus maximus]
MDEEEFISMKEEKVDDGEVTGEEWGVCCSPMAFVCLVVYPLYIVFKLMLSEGAAGSNLSVVFVSLVPLPWCHSLRRTGGPNGSLITGFTRLKKTQTHVPEVLFLHNSLVHRKVYQQFDNRGDSSFCSDLLVTYLNMMVTVWLFGAIALCVLCVGVCMEVSECDEIGLRVCGVLSFILLIFFLTVCVVILGGTDRETEREREEAVMKSREELHRETVKVALLRRLTGPLCRHAGKGSGNLLQRELLEEKSRRSVYQTAKQPRPLKAIKTLR